jgi:hypothetical protein
MIEPMQIEEALESVPFEPGFKVRKPSINVGGRSIWTDPWVPEPRKLCASCYDSLRSTAPQLSRLVASPRKTLKCENCGEVYYSDARKSRAKRKAA